MKTELTQFLQEELNRKLHMRNLDVVEVLPVQAHAQDRMVQLQTIHELIEELEDDSPSEEVYHYFIQVRPKAKKQKKLLQHQPVKLPDGRWNCSYLLENAKILFDSGELDLAETLYRRVEETGEYTGYAKYQLGRCAEEKGKEDEATELYEQSVAFEATVECYQRWISIQLRRDNYQQAAETIERALCLKEIGPDLRLEWLKKGAECWIHLKDYDRAEKNYQKALNVAPSSDDVRSNLGVLALQNRHYDLARRHFQDALASNPHNFQAVTGLGSCAFAVNDKKLAHDYFVRALEIEKNNPTAFYFLIKCAYELKIYAPTIRLLKEFLEDSLEHVTLHFSLAGLEYQTGQTEQSRQTCLKVLELEKDHAGATELLKRIDS